MATSGLTRRLRFVERQWSWLSFFVLAALCTAAAGALIDAGFLAEYELFPGILRGYTATGVLLGLSSLAFCGISFFYSLRKRGLQESLLIGRSTMTAWLWAHVYFGLLALVTAAVHAGHGLISLQFSAGKAAFFSLFGLVVSGLVWRVLYAVVPRSAAREVGNYSAQASATRAETLSIEIDKLSAGASPRFHELKAWALAGRPSDIQLRQAAASLPVPEQQRFLDVATLTESRNKFLERERKQKRYVRLLQGLRILHVPLSLLFLLFVPLHLVFAYDVPARVLPVGTFAGTSLGGFEPAENCADCHRRAVNEWRRSMHAHALTSPVMVAQSNQVLSKVLAQAQAPDPQRICVNCHGPLGAALTTDTKLPLASDSALSEDALLNEGISCNVCHQWQGTPETASGGFSRFQTGLAAGHRYFGPISDPVGNAFHQSEPSDVFRQPEQLCRNCHSVELDKNGDGQRHRGTDLVLQTLYEEWEDYRKAGGASDCVSCHMPLVNDARAAEHADIPFEQDHDAPPRKVHDHSFVAADYPLDDRAARDALRGARESLLGRAATLTVSANSVQNGPGLLKFALEVANTGTGHNLPGGFAFVRQMWLEVSVLDGAGQVLASSGHLASPSDDLCDSSILDNPQSPVRPFLRGCTVSDPLLVNFQQMLVDVTQVKVGKNGAPLLDRRGEPLLEAAANGREAVIQYLTAGPVARVRPFDAKPTAALGAGESHAFPYAIAIPNGALAHSVRVRLLFRSSPPYFLRALAAGESGAGAPALAGLVENLEVAEMAHLEIPLP